MIDRTTCSGKYELLYRELEQRAHEFITSAEDLKHHGCTITDHPKVLDCVIGFDTYVDECGYVTTIAHRKYVAYHFVAKRSLHNIGNKQSILISANWLEDVMNYWRLNIKENEHMAVVVFYNDFYFILDVKHLAVVHGLEVKTTRDKFTKTIPCYNPRSNTKELNRVIMIPVNWAEQHGYIISKEELDAIFKGHNENTGEKNTSIIINPVISPLI